MVQQNYPMSPYTQPPEVIMETMTPNNIVMNMKTGQIGFDRTTVIRAIATKAIRKGANIEDAYESAERYVNDTMSDPSSMYDADRVVEQQAQTDQDYMQYLRGQGIQDQGMEGQAAASSDTPTSFPLGPNQAGTQWWGDRELSYENERERLAQIAGEVGGRDFIFRNILDRQLGGRSVPYSFRQFLKSQNAPLQSEYALSAGLGALGGTPPTFAEWLPTAKRMTGDAYRALARAAGNLISGGADQPILDETGSQFNPLTSALYENLTGGGGAARQRDIAIQALGRNLPGMFRNPFQRFMARKADQLAYRSPQEQFLPRVTSSWQ